MAKNLQNCVRISAFQIFGLTKREFGGQNFTYKLITVSTTTNQFLAYQNKLVRAE